MPCYVPPPLYGPFRLLKRLPERALLSYRGNPHIAAEYLFVEGAGSTLHDQSGNNNHGTIYGATWTNINDIAWGLNFDGIDDYVVVPHSSSLMPSAVSVLAWVYPTSYGSPVNRILEKGGWHIGGGYTLEFNVGTHRGARWNIWNGLSWQNADSTSTIPLNTFTFIAGTFDGTTSKIYVNGTLEAQRTATMTTNTAPLTIGRRTYDVSYLFPGIIALIRIFRRALSDSEIRAIYNEEKVIFQP